MILLYAHPLLIAAAVIPAVALMIYVYRQTGWKRSPGPCWPN